jgi:hypothetical protein
MAIDLEPTREFLLPYDGGDMRPFNFEEELELSGNTARAQLTMGAELETDVQDVREEKKLFTAAMKDKNIKALNRQPTALMAYEFIQEYGKIMAWDVAEVRRAITTKLLALADCGEPKHELKALELLGKHSDIQLFTERSEVKITYENANDLEESIKEKLKRVLGSTLIDVTPTKERLDNDFGVLNAQELENQVREDLKKERILIPGPKNEPK